MKKRSELLFSLVLVPIDYLAAITGFVFAYAIRLHAEKPIAYQIPARQYIKFMLVLLPVWILFFALSGLYNLQSTRSRFSEIGRILVATAGGVMFLILVDFVSQDPIIPSKSVPVYGFAMAFILIVIARQIVRGLQRFLWRFGVGVHNVFVVGTGKVAKDIMAALTPAHNGYRLLNHEIEAEPANYKNLKGVDLLSKINQIHQIDEIVMTDSRLDDKGQLEVIEFSQEHQISYKFVPATAGLFRSKAESVPYSTVPVLEIVQTPLEGWGRIVKRTVDLLASALGILILSPIFLSIAILIKIFDPGPVFYLHRRLSREGKKINVYKFRSMKRQYCVGPAYKYKSNEQVLAEIGDSRLLAEFKQHQKLKDDPRVSRLGRFLRRTSLDELPQLFNVLMGNLSLVGPRPITQDELKRYGKVSSKFLAIKPGLTGLWQVSGRNDISYDERIKLDIYYIENWSLWADLMILLKTFRLILRGRGGY